MKKQLDTKDLLEFKFSMTDDSADKGVFSGYASVFGVVDSYGDVVVAGAFKKTLKDTNPVPMLWNHSVDQPIGLIHLTEEERGLKAEGHLNLDVARAQEIRSLMKQGAIKGLSIGYQTVREAFDKTANTRLLKEVKLWEVSPVVFPANTSATITDVKSAEELDALTEEELDIKTETPDSSTSPEDTSTPSAAHLLEQITTLRRS